jgi:acetylornithine deacetylase/succinyl-diaminopimelate desuccinylase-like protein
VKVRREGDTLYAPGIGDDTCSLPVLLAFIRAMNRADTRPRPTSCSWAMSARKARATCAAALPFNEGKYKDRITHFISFEPGFPGRVTNAGTGSRRYKVTFKGPGGHAWAISAW